MKSIISHVYHFEDVAIDKVMDYIWQEASKARNKVAKAVSKISKSNIVKSLKNFWRNNKTAIVVAGVTLLLYGFGLLPISIFLFIV